jgi:prepilin-type N-terminal cleavage/methylation domain-containing protein
MKGVIMNKGLTLIEVIISLAVIGLVITPLMSMFVFAAQINSESSLKLKSVLTAQKYIEEFKASEELNFGNYVFNSDTGAYEKTVVQTADEFGAQIIIRSERSHLYSIEVSVFDGSEVICSINSSKIIN